MTQSVQQPVLREELLERRQTVEVEIDRIGHRPHLDKLIDDVNGALSRMEEGSFGLCETCHEPIEAERVMADPLVRFCLDHLTDSEQRALERDLELAARIQRALLPAAHAKVNGWEITYHYEPAGVVSGDHCDYLTTDRGDLYFVIGDVSGKGVAASMLMTHLHATLRMLIVMDLPLDDLMGHVSRQFMATAIPPLYATLVCGKATRDGRIEMSNAGHPPPLLVREERIERIDATGLPIGLFQSERFDVARLELSTRDTLILYTDGVVEAQDGSGAEYGPERLSAIAANARTSDLAGVMDASLRDLTRFRGTARKTDDLTFMAVRWDAEASRAGRAGGAGKAG